MMTEELEGLKRDQADLTQRLDGVVVWFDALVKQKEEAEEKAAKSKAAAALLAASTLTETPAKTESAKAKAAEEGGEASGLAKGGAVEIRRSVSASQYCETRANLIDAHLGLDDGGESHDCDVSVKTLRRSDKKDDRLYKPNQGDLEENGSDWRRGKQGRRSLARSVGSWTRL